MQKLQEAVERRNNHCAGERDPEQAAGEEAPSDAAKLSISRAAIFDLLEHLALMILYDIFMFFTRASGISLLDALQRHVERQGG
jgi:hypothetical protein